MAALTNVTTAVAAAATEGDVKNWLTSVYNYLVGLFGADGTKPTAIATLGASPFPAGTLMLFVQAAAPVGWTKSTAHNDKVLRVVSGPGGGSGGVQAFSTVFGRTATDGSSLSIDQLAAHSHSYKTSNGGSAGSGSGIAGSSSSLSINTGSQGSGAAHSHGLDLRVQYVDVIIASKV